MRQAKPPLVKRETDPMHIACIEMHGIRPINLSPEMDYGAVTESLVSTFNAGLYVEPEAVTFATVTV